jgi:hypothetical protein
MPFVYFIHETGCNNCFKIGKTDNHPADRMEQLQTGNPRRLRIYRWVKIGDNSTLEQYLHQFFVKFHVFGEWYNVTTDQIDEQCAVIISVNSSLIISGTCETYTDADRLAVKKERAEVGKYRGKTNPAAAAKKKYNYMDRKRTERDYNLTGFSGAKSNDSGLTGFSDE